MNLNNFIFDKNKITVPNICELELLNDICIVHKILIPFNKSELFFKVIHFICAHYNMNICLINDDPKYELHNLKIDSSFYYYKYYTKNPFIKNNFCMYNPKQEYDIYNYDLVYSVGDEEFQKFKKNYDKFKDEELIKLILELRQIPDIKNINLLNNFNISLKDVFKDKNILMNVSKFYKLNNILNCNYIKLFK